MQDKQHRISKVGHGRPLLLLHVSCQHDKQFDRRRVNDTWQNAQVEEALLDCTVNENMTCTDEDDVRFYRAMLRRARYCYGKVVCPSDGLSVRPSVTLRYWRSLFATQSIIIVIT